MVQLQGGSIFKSVITMHKDKEKYVHHIHLLVSFFGKMMCVAAFYRVSVKFQRLSDAETFLCASPLDAPHRASRWTASL